MRRTRNPIRDLLSGLSLEELLPKPPRQRPRRRRGKGGGSEPVTVEPNRPKLGEGGAAAALEFDER
jgi:hypothetical protein